MEVPPFPIGARSLIIATVKNGDAIKRDVVHMLMPPTLWSKLKSYWAMWAFGNHIRVSIVEKHLTTCDSGVAIAFEQEYVLGPMTII